jgi:hypothetical protein
VKGYSTDEPGPHPTNPKGRPMSGVQFDELPLDPEIIKQHIKVRREAIALMLREVSALSAALERKIGAPAMIAWMASQAKVTDDILATTTEFVNKGKTQGGDTP